MHATSKAILIEEELIVDNARYQRSDGGLEARCNVSPIFYSSRGST
jgi:hypothetical protein